MDAGDSCLLRQKVKGFGVALYETEVAPNNGEHALNFNDTAEMPLYPKGISRVEVPHPIG